mmetsp:Transcript_21872/g.67856  ORF Transcript_21872/g.67856 Transcript_21872/m.67856 type:complete len:233 (-) Transcript_21872:17-715(-)
MRARRVHGAGVCRLALVEEDEVVERVEDLRGRLVDRANHANLPRARELCEHLNGYHRHRGIKAGCRLVEEHDGRLDEELLRNAQPLALATRNTAHERRSHLGVLARLEAQKLDRLAHALVGRPLVALEAQPRQEAERLAHGELRKDNVVLLDERNAPAKRLGPAQPTEEHVARRDRDAVRDRREQRGLPAARRAHERREPAGLRCAAHALERLVCSDRHAHIRPRHGDPVGV